MYQYAAQWMEQQHLQSIIDLGCGSGYKTVHYLGQYQTTGVEVDPTYSWLTKTYPDKKWLLFDNLKPSELTCDLIVCSDVIEHIEHPDDLLDFVAEMNFKQVIFSTPDRDRLYGTKDFGPPENTCHYREWNHIEFKNYLRGWFEIIDTQLINDKSNTQLVICQKHKKTNT
ncbi:MAG: class I SAM-dependent methyltransferase [Chitinophagaceae bacterium]|nr:class I SAM-dependent methyltransferase [Chitinophagaceae bacterium]